MAQLKAVPRDRIEGVLDELEDHCVKGSPVPVDESVIRAMLTRRWATTKASNLLRILQPGDTSGIEGLKWMDAPTVADLIKNEHPQIIATILVHLEFDHAGEILKAFSPNACATTFCCASPRSTAYSRCS